MDASVPHRAAMTRPVAARIRQRSWLRTRQRQSGRSARAGLTWSVKIDCYLRRATTSATLLFAERWPLWLSPPAAVSSPRRWDSCGRAGPMRWLRRRTPRALQAATRLGEAFAAWALLHCMSV